MNKIRFELFTKPSKAEKEAQGKSGFVVVKARWVIERSNAGWKDAGVCSQTMNGL